VIDTGIHNYGWTHEQARNYLRNPRALSEHEIETEVDRYIAWPGQALATSGLESRLTRDAVTGRGRSGQLLPEVLQRLGNVHVGQQGQALRIVNQPGLQEAVVLRVGAGIAAQRLKVFADITI
jgi:hypothetical protein